MPLAPPTDEQLLQEIEVLKECGWNRTHAATKLGIPRSTVVDHVRLAVNRGLIDLVEPVKAIPDGLHLKGVSEYVRTETGGQWIKTDADAEARARALQAAIEAASEKIPRAKPLSPPKDTDTDLCNLYTLTDCHVGMLSWHRETGKDWDLEIAERVLKGCFEDLVRRSPKAHTCVVAQLGDFLHWDGLESVTPTGGHILDADGRFEKVTRVAVRILRHVIDHALKHHEHVHVLMVEGNHDIASSVWLRVIFSALYENEPRVTIDTSPLPYYAFQWGQTALFWHHGHKKKFRALPGLFAAQFPEIWGSTKKRYGHTGHYHSEESFEENGIKMRQHPTLASRDAYAARGGWISEQEATAYTFHKKRGQIASITTNPEMLEDAA